MAKQPATLIILDGFANRESEHGNLCETSA